MTAADRAARSEHGDGPVLGEEARAGLQVGARVRIESRGHPAMPAADFMVRLHGSIGTVVPSHGHGYTDDRPRLVDLDDDRGSVLVNTMYLHELVPGPSSGLPLGENARQALIQKFYNGNPANRQDAEDAAQDVLDALATVAPDIAADAEAGL